MKQSKAQPNKAEVQFPDYITVKQYNDVMELKADGSIYYKMNIIAMVTGMPVKEVKKLPIEIMPRVYDDCVGMFMKKEEPIQAIKFRGKTLILSLAFLKTVGEFVDLEAHLANQDTGGICSILFQNYEDELEGNWVDFGDLQVMYVNNNIHKLNSNKLQAYDSNNNFDSEFFDSFPVSLYQSTIAFTAGIGTSFSISSKNYSLGNQQSKELLKQMKLIMDGLGTYSVLQKLTSCKSLKKVA